MKPGLHAGTANEMSRVTFGTGLLWQANGTVPASNRKNIDVLGSLREWVVLSCVEM